MTKATESLLSYTSNSGRHIHDHLIASDQNLSLEIRCLQGISQGLLSIMETIVANGRSAYAICRTPSSFEHLRAFEFLIPVQRQRTNKNSCFNQWIAIERALQIIMVTTRYGGIKPKYMVLHAVSKDNTFHDGNYFYH